MRERDTRTREQRLASETLFDYYDAADAADVLPQSLRKALQLRYEHMEEDAKAKGLPKFDPDVIDPVTGMNKRNGDALATDIPEPEAWRKKQPRREPRWRECTLRAYWIRVGAMSNEDALTPLKRRPPGRPKGSGRVKS